MAFSGMINVKTGQLTLGGQFDAYKRGQLERNIQTWPALKIVCRICSYFQILIIDYQLSFSTSK